MHLGGTSGPSFATTREIRALSGLLANGPHRCIARDQKFPRSSQRRAPRSPALPNSLSLPERHVSKRAEDVSGNCWPLVLASSSLLQASSDVQDGELTEFSIDVSLLITTEDRG